MKYRRLEKEIGIDAELIDSCAFGDPRTCKIGFDERLWETSGAAEQSGQFCFGLILVAERCDDEKARSCESRKDKLQLVFRLPS